MEVTGYHTKVAEEVHWYYQSLAPLFSPAVVRSRCHYSSNRQYEMAVYAWEVMASERMHETVTQIAVVHPHSSFYERLYARSAYDEIQQEPAQGPEVDIAAV